MKTTYLKLLYLIAGFFTLSCTQKTACPEFESYFLDYYPNGEGEEILFRNIETPDETMIIRMGGMRVDHVSAIKQNIINGKSTCYCWSKVEINFRLKKLELHYHISMSKTDESTIDYMQIQIEDLNKFDGVDYYLSDDVEIQSIIDSESVPVENYHIFSNDNSGLVFENGIGLVLIKVNNKGTWIINKFPKERPFDWDQIRYDEFDENC